MSNKSAKFLLILIIQLFFYFSFAQSSYYLANSGADSNNGSISQPWKTLSLSVNKLQAGDTLWIREGIYKGLIDIQVSGDTDRPIVIKNYPEEKPVINGEDLSEGEFLLKIENQSDIKISGLIFKDFQKNDAQGVLIINSKNILIENNEFVNIDYATDALGQTPTEDKNAQPIIVFGRNSQIATENIRIINNQIHDCETGWSEALSLNGNIDGFEIKGNKIYKNTNIGIVAIGFEGECANPDLDQARNGVISENEVYDNPSAYDAAAGIYIDGGRDILVEKNIVYRNDYGIEVGCENNGGANNNPSSSGISVINNLIFKNKLSGLVIGGYNYPVSGKVENSVFRNNTLYYNDTDQAYNGEMYLTYIENTIIENNILFSYNVDNVLFISEKDLSGVGLNYNMYYTRSELENQIVIEINGTEYNSFSAYRQSLSQDIHSFYSNPLFTNKDLAFPDLHLQAQSPCINTGNPSTQIIINETDIDGDSRILNNQVDIGCDEFDSSASVENWKNEAITCFPNPVTDVLFISSPKGFSYQIIDINGRMIKKGIGKKEINFKSIDRGIYFLIIEGNRFFKIIKK